MDEQLSPLASRWAGVQWIVHTYMHVYANTQLETWRRKFDLACSDKDLSPPNTSLSQSAGLSATLCHWQLGTQWCATMCVCVCVSPNLLTHSYYTGATLSRHLWISTLPSLHSLLRDRDLCVCEVVYMCVLCSLAPCLSPDSEMRQRKEHGSGCHTLQKE